MTSLVSYETPKALILPDAAIGAWDPVAALAPALPPALVPALAAGVGLASSLPMALGTAPAGAPAFVEGDPTAVLQAAMIKERTTSAAGARRASAIRIPPSGIGTPDPAR